MKREVVTGKEIGRLDPIEAERHLGAWTPDGKVHAVISENTVALYKDGGDW